MARRTKKSPKDYPKVIVFDENLDGAAAIIEAAKLNLPEIWTVVKGKTDHQLAVNLKQWIVFFTCDKHWLTRQPPYKHGGIILLDMGNSSIEGKTRRIMELINDLQRKHKSLDLLRNRRFRLTKNGFFEKPIGEKEHRLL